ncbi:MAG TPA: efflux RND transporter periplasmic adaptor subunit [Devosia sp.]|nr:efflux RND transporter periplasmic adaptor subunit [Devosia sp.]
MRALLSYGLAFIFLVVAGAWLATGTLVVGGNGPGKGEKPIISVIEGEPDGPIHNTLADAGVLAPPPHEESATAIDPALTIAQRNEEATGAAVAPQSVRTVTYMVQSMPLDVPLRGRTRAKASVTAVAETAGIIDSVAVSKGQRVTAGDLLCTLDQGTRQAAVAQANAGLAQANAGLVQAQLDYDTNADLRKKGLAAANTGRPLEVALTAAQASVTSAQAALDNAKAELDRTEIVAKVDGIVQDPLATTGSMLAVGQPCATIVQLDPMVFIAQVPESRIALAKTGLDASIATVTGQTVKGKVSFISETADPATRSFPIEIEVPNADFSLRDGVTATATVSLGAVPAHLVPQSVLTLNDNGELGVRAVEDSKAKFYPVEIASDTREGVWLLGLPAKVDIITVGQEFVNDGQTVAATNVTAAEGTAS